MSRRGDGPPREIAAYDAILTFGGEMHADQEDKHPWLRFEKDFLAAIVEDGVPILAVCLGSQLLAEAAEGSAHRASRPEIGWHPVEVTEEGEGDPLLGPLAPGFTAFQWHSYEFVPPPGAAVLAGSPVCAQAYRVGERAWGIQFHAEVTGPSAARWIDKRRDDEDEALREETERRIGEWNRLGRELCGRFIDQVASAGG